MAADKSVRSFIILFYVGCIVSYGSCAPVEEKIVLDNGTVLTKVIYDVKEPPPLRYDSALDASHTDEAADPNIIIHEAQHPQAPHAMSKRSADDTSPTDEADDPNIIIHEAKYPPAPHAMSKRSADADPEDDDSNVKIETGQPRLASTPRSDSEKKLSEVSPPGAVAAAAVQTTIGVPKPDEPVDNGASETKRVPESSKSEDLHGKAVSQPDGGGDAKEQDKDEGEDDKEEKTTTPIALPVESTGKVDGSGKNDSKVGSDDQRNDQRDTRLPVEESGSSTPSGDISVNIKSTTEKKTDEVVDNKLPPADDEPKDKDIAKPSVEIPVSDDDSDDDDDGDDPTSNDGDDNDDDGEEEVGDKGRLNTDGGGDKLTDDEKGEEDYGDEDDDDNGKPNTEKNAASNGNEDEDAEQDEDEDDVEDDKSLVDGGNNKGKPSSSGETSETEGGLKKNTSDEPQSSGQFMSYFLIAVVFVACFYLIFHNRQKIKAYVLEGKTGRGGRRRKAGNSEYRQLSTADEVLPDTDKGIESKTTYTY